MTFQGFQAEVDPNAAAARDEAFSGGDGIFPPLPKGKYQAVLVPLKDGTPFEVQPFGGQGANAHKQVVRVAFKIIDASPTGNGRILFARIPLFSRYAPSQKKPEGAPARAYWDFWEKALGTSSEQVIAGQLPALQPHFGRQVTLSLSAPVQPRSDKDLEYNPLGTNEIDFYDAAGDVNTTPVLQPGQALAPWITPENTVVPGFLFEFQKAQQAQFPQAAPATSFGAAPNTPANVTQFPGQVTNLPVPSWSQPATDPAASALQAAAAGGGRSF